MANAPVFHDFSFPEMPRRARCSRNVLLRATRRRHRLSQSSGQACRLAVPRWLMRLAGLLAILSHTYILPRVANAQELPLERCDSLPVIDVQVAGLHKLFLVDTAATSILNLESFSAGQARDIHVTSWSGTLATSAKEVTLPDLSVGRTK